jgi:hypothetical protein
MHKLKSSLALVLLMVNFSYINAKDNNFYIQATEQLAVTNFDYVTTLYFNTSLEAFYNFESSNFVVGGGLGTINSTTDTFFASNGAQYNSKFAVPYATLFGGFMFKPLPKIRNTTVLRLAQSFWGRSSCDAQSGAAGCNPANSDLGIIQIGARSSTMYFFTPNLYASFNIGLDLNSFKFSPAFSVNPDNLIRSRTYHNPGPNLGLSLGVNF